MAGRRQPRAKIRREHLALAAASIEAERRRGPLDDPVRWAEAVLRVSLWSKQRQIIYAVRDHRRVAVRSCHGVGKTFVAAVLAAWWIASHPPGSAFVVATAPTLRQVRSIFWRELGRAHATGRLPGRLNQAAEWWIGDRLVALGLKPADSDPTSLQGIHARLVLVIVDEAAGVPSALWDAASSLTANEESRLLAIGNPDDPGSRFAAVCRPGSGFHVIGISAHDSPNFTGEEVPDGVRPLLVSPVWVRERAAEWGRSGEFDEFDLNAFFEASGRGKGARFKHQSDVQKWLEIIRGAYVPWALNELKAGSRPAWPYSDDRLLPYLQHSFWFLPDVAACHAMANLLTERHNTFWRGYKVVLAAGASAGIGLEALPPVRKAIGSGFDTKTITLSCGKLTTGVTVPQWSSILMLRNLKSPETYFQAAFRVQSPWSIVNPDGDDPNEEEILKPTCFVFDFAPTRALRQLSEYGFGLSPNEPNPESAVRDLVAFLPVLAYDGANMLQVDAGAILDIAMAGTSATLLARKWQSALLVNVDNDTLRRILDNDEAMAVLGRIEGWRALGENVLETIINKSEKVREIKDKAKTGKLTASEKQELSEAEKEYKSKRKLVQEKLIKFATRIPAFMYLTDFRENTLQDVITKLEPELFLSVTGLTIDDFHLLVQLRVFNTEQMNQAVFAFRRYEDASLSYAGIDSHPGLTHIGLYDTVVAREVYRAAHRQ